MKETELYELYYEDDMSTTDIAKMYQCSNETIRKRMKKWGIPRRTLSQSQSGKRNSQYTDGGRVGEHKNGYQRKGYNPWNKGLTKATSEKLAETSEKIREGVFRSGTAFQPRKDWTVEDCVRQTKMTAKGLRMRESRKGTYIEYLKLLGPGWKTEHFQRNFIFIRDDGMLQGFVVDLAHRGFKVAVEIDGKGHESWYSDKSKDERLDQLGWKVIRVSSVQRLRTLAGYHD